MSERINAGYVITDSLHIGNVEMVIGESPSAPMRFVTWECRDGNNYYWGHYIHSRLEAVRDFIDRAEQELIYQNRTNKQPEKEKGAYER